MYLVPVELIWATLNWTSCWRFVSEIRCTIPLRFSINVFNDENVSSIYQIYPGTVKQCPNTWTLFCPPRYKFLSTVLPSTNWHCIRFCGNLLPNLIIHLIKTHKSNHTLFCSSNSKHPINMIALYYTAEHERSKHWIYKTINGKYANDHEYIISLYECFLIVLFFHTI